MSEPKTDVPAKKPDNPNAIIIDARAATYDGDAVRVMAVSDANSGKIKVAKEKLWREQPDAKGNTIVVTDTPNVFKHWGLAFDEKTQMPSVMAAYKAANAAGLLLIDDSLKRYDPTHVIQTRKVDERGKSLDFDSMGINNGHIAVLLAVWAARLAHGGYVITKQPDAPSDNEASGFDMMPFSI
jgi:hypothetical protein